MIYRCRWINICNLEAKIMNNVYLQYMYQASNMLINFKFKCKDLVHSLTNDPIYSIDAAVF